MDEVSTFWLTPVIGLAAMGCWWTWPCVRALYRRFFNHQADEIGRRMREQGWP